MFQRILLAWDGSDVARRALDVAIDLTRRFDGELVAVAIAYSPAHAETESDRTESADAARSYLEETFSRVRDRADRAGVPIEFTIAEGDEPVDALLAHAHDHGFDLIVCGQHHSGRIGRLLLHGVPGRLIDAAALPVLVVNGPNR